MGGADISNVLDNVSVVVRSVGERTEAACKRLILTQNVPPESVFSIHEFPFSKALSVGFEIGLVEAKKWTIFVDADLLLRGGSIQKMVASGERAPGNVCELHGYVLDKFFGGARMGGVHLYRTSLLELARGLIPKEGENIRPESHVLRSMTDLGFPWRSVPELVGLHDFDQSYEDVYRKCFVQAHKHAHLFDLFLDFWRDRTASDLDYQVALAGFSAGIAHYGEVRIDKQADYFRRGMKVMGIEEKPPLDPGEWSAEAVEEVIRDWREPDKYWNFFPDGVLSKGNTRLRRLALSAKLHTPRKLRKIILWRASRHLLKLSQLIGRHA